MQHIREVNAGLIPATSPVDFIRADWVPDADGKPGWFAPDWDPDQRNVDAIALQDVNTEGQP